MPLNLYGFLGSLNEHGPASNTRDTPLSFALKKKTGKKKEKKKGRTNMGSVGTRIVLAASLAQSES